MKKAKLTSKSKRLKRWGLFELELKGPKRQPVHGGHAGRRSSAKAAVSLLPEGFYDGDGVYKVGFMPDEEGVWKYDEEQPASQLSGVTGEVVCTKAKGGNHGPVHVRNTYHFGYADGEAYWPVGTTCYGWAFKTLAKQKQTIASLKKAPFNKMRMIVLPFAGSRTKKFPFPGKSRETWDFRHFNPEFFRHYEKRIKQLLALGIEADLILFHPYDKGRFGFDTMPHEVNIRFIRYCVARFGAYRNVWWSIANEFDFVRTRKMSEWDSFGQAVANMTRTGSSARYTTGHRCTTTASRG